ncbi:MAG: class I SAM-dependent methyltransferase [Oscillospiraceae bacterium]|nr:class I SAM-dependent methyltransferase [Oscillospiraceae bacterium]
MKSSYTDINSKAIDGWVESGWEWGVSISREAYAAAKNGQWSVVLTPKKPVPQAWFSPLMKDGGLGGAKLLGLASGGGQQMPVFAALGADCTVFDYSEKQLESEKAVSEREGYAISIVRGDMAKRLPFEDGAFDIIFHPVSNCYVEDVRHVWNECFRVLKKGGILLSGMDNGVGYLTEEENPLLIVNKLPYNPLKDEALYKRCIQTDGSIQFSHTLEEQIGGQLAAGFVLTDLYEDTDGDGIGEYIPTFIATRAVKA